MPGTGGFEAVAVVAAAANAGARGEVGPMPPGITRLGTQSPCTTLGGVYGVGAEEMNLLLWCCGVEVLLFVVLPARVLQ